MPSTLKSPWKTYPISSLILAALLAVGCGPNGNSAVQEVQAPKMVKAAVVDAAQNRSVRSFPALVQPARETNLAFRVGGPLVELSMKIGQNLKQGDVVARIDPRDFELNIRRLQAALKEARARLRAMKKGARPEDMVQMEADLAAARAQLNEAQSNLERYQALFDQKAVARATLDSALTGFELAQARVKASEQTLVKGREGAREEDIDAMEAQITRLKLDLQGAQNALADATLKAPFDGYINQIFVENFESINPGQPIVSFMDVSIKELRTSIPRDLLVRQDQWEGLTCTFETRPGRAVPAQVRELGQKSAGPGQSFPLICRFQAPEDMDVRPGMAAEVQVALKNGKHALSPLRVSTSALFAGPDGRAAVWRINPETMTVEKALVQTGPATAETVQILDGLEPGDQVVTAGARFLRQGQKVRILGQGKGDGA